jgi:hypothetical protein
MLSVLLLLACSRGDEVGKPTPDLGVDSATDIQDGYDTSDITCPVAHPEECNDLAALGCPFVILEAYPTVWGCQMSEPLDSGCREIYASSCPTFEEAKQNPSGAEYGFLVDHCGGGTSDEFYRIRWTEYTDFEQDDRDPVYYDVYFDAAGVMMTLYEIRDPHVGADCCDGTFTDGRRWGSDLEYDTSTCTPL